MNKSTKKKKPLIGITCCISFANDPKRSFNIATEIQYIQRHYLEMVWNGGGIPILLPLQENLEDSFRIAQRIDGIILTGGPEDVDPDLYNESNSNSHDVNPVRDASEIELMKQMRKLSKPVLGVCRGIQILNVAMGGANYQDIPSQVKSALPHPLDENKKEVFHNISFPTASILIDLFGNNEIRVNSSHHQSVKTPGVGLSVTAIASDGVIEAVQCFEDKCTVGVQWHPERMQYDEKMISLTNWFVEQARSS